MTNIGQFVIWFAFIATGISFSGYIILQINRENQIAKTTARLSFFIFAALLTIASMFLMNFILNHEFIYSYVTRYTSRDLPIQYLISAFWAGQEGSFLLWVLLGSWLGLFLIYKSKDYEPPVMITYNLISLFLMILLIKQSPFSLLSHAPRDGQGMNMLLQDPWMVVHPPITFLGYAAYGIPFSYAIAALWRKEYDQWTKPALPWAIFAFVTLGAGIMIGGYWSYKVLGWGGYWGWDPVENASLLPWLVGIALLHGMILQQSMGRLRKTNFLLAIISYLLIIYCTFLTRSGVLADFSVHSFTDLGITGFLVLFLLTLSIGSAYLFAIRANEIPDNTAKGALNILSREFGFVMAIASLILIALITGLGTSAPLITRILETPSKVDTSFYADANMPLAIVVLLLLSIVPHLKWGENQYRSMIRKLTWAIVGAVIAVSIAFINGHHGISIMLLTFFAGAASGLNFALVFSLIRKKVSLSSGAVAHLGVGLMFLGIIASTVYDQGEKAEITQDAAQAVLGYEVKLLNPFQTAKTNKMQLTLPMEVQKGNTTFSAQSFIFSESVPGGQERHFVHPYIRRGLISDLYISPMNFDSGQPPSHSSHHIDLKLGVKKAISGYEFLFTGFDVSNMMGLQNPQDIKVGANIEVSFNGEAPVMIKPFFSPNKPHDQSDRVKLPGGPQKAYITLVAIEAGAKTIHLDYQTSRPIDTGSAGKTSPSVIAEISIKPGMTLLWTGTFLILLGGGIGIARRKSRST